MNTPAYLAAQCNLAAVQALNVAPNTGNINIRSVPYDERQIVYSLTGDYRLEPEVESHRLVRAGEPRALEPRARQDVGVPVEARLHEPRARRRRRAALVRIRQPPRQRLRAEPVRGVLQRSARARAHVARHQHGRTGSRRTARCASSTSRTATRTSSRRDSTGPGSRRSTPGSTLQYNGVRYPDSAYGRNGTNEQTSVSLNLDYEPEADVGSVRLLHVAEREDEPGGVAGERLRDGNHVLLLQQRRASTRRGTRARGTRRWSATTQVTPGNWQQVCSDARRRCRRSTRRAGRGRTRRARPTRRSRSAGTTTSRKARFDVNYTYVNGRTKTSYTYNADAYDFTPDAARADRQRHARQRVHPEHRRRESARADHQGGRGPPLLPLRERPDQRLALRRRPAEPRTVPTAVYLDYGPQSYHASIAGVFLRYAF